MKIVSNDFHIHDNLKTELEPSIPCAALDILARTGPFNAGLPEHAFGGFRLRRSPEQHLGFSCRRSGEGMVMRLTLLFKGEPIRRNLSLSELVAATFGCVRILRRSKMAQAGCALVIGLFTTQAAQGAEGFKGIRIDSDAARRTVDAISRPNLTREQALSIADLTGNQALVAQAKDFGFPETRDTFADALIAAARGSDAFSIFNFPEVRSTAEIARTSMNVLQLDPAALTEWITRRLAPFVPPEVPLTGTGYIIAGGPGGGFSIDGGVYVNISRAKGELGVIRVDLTHEFYHGIQHAAQARAGTLGDFNYADATYQKLSPGLARRCYVTRQLFGSLMEEGTASYVGDIALYPTTGPEALSVRKQRELSLSGKVGTPIALLDIGLAAVTSDDPVSERSVYSIGFLEAGQLYYDLAYVMAKAIATHDGDAAIGRMISQPGDVFVRRYIEISEEPGSNLPKLKDHTKSWATRRSCSS